MNRRSHLPLTIRASSIVLIGACSGSTDILPGEVDVLVLNFDPLIPQLGNRTIPCA